MVVEDQRIILQGIVKMIGHCAPEARTYPFDSARDALEALMDIRPDVTLTDIVMEGMDGLAFVREAAARLPGCRFVIVSGYPSFAYAQEAISLKVYAYLLKPIDRRQLEKILSDIRGELTPEEGPAYSHLTRAALDCVRTRSDRPLTVAGIAEELHVAPNYLSNLVKKETGQTMSGLIRQAQMENAERWLRTTDMYLYEIAERLGYRDVKYFSLLFKEHYRDTPLHYRKARRERNP